MFICVLITLSSRAEMLGLQPDTWEPVTSIPNLSELIPMMRNVLHLAVAFSPLIVLVPKKFTHETIRRDHLLAVSPIFLYCSNH